MEEDEYKATYNEIAAVRCEFEKALTNQLYSCALSQHFCLADREGYACKSVENADQCTKLLQILRNKSRFLFKLQRTGEPLPHNMEIRVQSGGILGIKESLLEKRPTQNFEGISDIVETAIAEFGDINDLPYSTIVQSIAAIKVRKRSKK